MVGGDHRHKVVTSHLTESAELTKSDQMIISWEKQNTPSLPPFRVPSKILPESATMFSPSNILERNIDHNGWQEDCDVLPQSDESNLWSVEQQPPVGHLLSPADIAGILPEQLDLPVSVACVPQRVPHHLTFKQSHECWRKFKSGKPFWSLDRIMNVTKSVRVAH